MATISSKKFGTLSCGTEVTCFTLKNKKGTTVEILDYGARLHSVQLWTPHGEPKNVIASLPLADYEMSAQNAILGRLSNPMTTANIGDKPYEITCPRSFHEKLWQTEITPTGLTLRYRSEDGEGGFPGTMLVTLTYGLTNDNELSVSLNAVADDDTLCNISTRFAFTVENAATQKLQLFSSHAVEKDGALTEEEENLRVPQAIHRYEQAHFFCVNGTFAAHEQKEIYGLDPACPIHYEEEHLRKAARLQSEDTGLTLTMYTNSPCTRAHYQHAENSGILYLSPERHPSTKTHAEFPSSYLPIGRVFRSHTVYRLSWE